MANKLRVSLAALVAAGILGVWFWLPFDKAPEIWEFTGKWETDGELVTAGQVVQLKGGDAEVAFRSDSPFVLSVGGEEIRPDCVPGFCYEELQSPRQSILVAEAEGLVGVYGVSDQGKYSLAFSRTTQNLAGQVQSWFWTTVALATTGMVALALVILAGMRIFLTSKDSHRGDWGPWEDHLISDFAGAYYRERTDTRTGRRFFQYSSRPVDRPGDGTEVPSQ